MNHSKRFDLFTGTVLIAFVVAIIWFVVWWGVPVSHPVLSDSDTNHPRVRASIKRLEVRLRHPESLRVISVVNPQQFVATVEIEFEARGSNGTGRSRFWVRWTDSGPVDGFPESPGGARDDPNGLFRD